MSALSDIATKAPATPPLPGLGKPGWADDPNNPASLKNPAMIARFQAMADAGFFGQPSWLSDINNEVESAYGNNNQAYDGAYAQAMQGARANITQQIGHALGEINARQGTANQGLQALPGQYQGTFDRATAGVNSDLASMNAAETQANAGQAGGATFSPGNAAAQPGLAAIQASNAGAQAGIPVLQMSFDNAFSKQRQDVQTQGDQQLSDLDQKEAEHNASLAESLSQSKAETTKSLILQHYQQQAADTKAAQTAAAKQAAAAVKAFAQQPAGVTPNGGKVLVKNMPDLAASIKAGQSGRASSAYADAMKAIGPLVSDKAHVKPADVRAAIAGLMKTYPKQAQAISLAVFDLGIPQGAY